MTRIAPRPRPLGPMPAGAGGRRAQWRFAVSDRYDLAGTVGPLVVGRHDPTARLGPGEFWRAARTPDGPGVVHLSHRGGEVTVTGYGPGGEWLAGRADELAGVRHPDRGGRADDFAPVAERHPVTARLAAARPGVLLPRSGRVFQELVATILQQKVTWVEAVRAYTRLVRHFGVAAPGPVPLLLPPDPAAVAATPYWVFHPWGVEQRRADTIRRAAGVAERLEETVEMPPEAAARRLRAVPGIGPWTVGEVGRLAYGDPDAVSIGDFHLPHQVAWTLAGEPRGGDDRMLELLEPFTGHRGRVIRLIVAAGSRPPRRGPRAPLRSFARY